MDELVELRQYLAMARKGWRLMILGAVVAAAIGYGVSQRQPRVYEAVTTLIVGQAIQSSEPNSQDIQTSERLAQTYAVIVRRQPVLQRTVEALNLSDTWRELRKRARVELVKNTQLLEIRVQANSPDVAQLTADEIARQLILLSPTANLQNQENDDDQRFVRGQLRALKTKIEAGQVSVEALEAAITPSLSVERAQELQSEISILERLIADWQANYAGLLPFVGEKKSSNSLAVVEPAQIDPTATRPRVLLNTLLAGAVGLILALGVVFLRERLDDRFRSADDLSRSLGLTYLGAVGRIEGRQYPSQLITSHGPFSAAAEAYRIIRSNIRLKSGSQPAKAILVTSSTSGEGKSLVAANLGVVMAQAGLKTIIVDADLRRPVQHQIFNVPNVGGVTSLLGASELEINGHLRDTQIENLKVVTSGVLPLDPSELLNLEHMKQLLANLKALAEVIIFDSPPILPVADAVVLSTQVDGVVLVIDAQKTHRGAVRQAVLNLRSVGAALLGGVLNRASDLAEGYYYETYGSDRLRPIALSKGPTSPVAPSGLPNTRLALGLRQGLNALKRYMANVQRRLSGKLHKGSSGGRPGSGIR